MSIAINPMYGTVIHDVAIVKAANIISTYNDLVTDAEKGETYTLADSVTVKETITVKNGKTLTIKQEQEIITK